MSKPGRAQTAVVQAYTIQVYTYTIVHYSEFSPPFGVLLFGGPRLGPERTGDCCFDMIFSEKRKDNMQNDNKIFRRQAIANFLRAKARPDLADLYTPDMEVQVNVAQDGGDRIEGEYEGHTWAGWTDGLQTWKSFRVPHKANSEPEYNDSVINFDLEQHAEGIGMTGWNWVRRVSQWVAFDFDAITGHSENHLKKLTEGQITEVRKLACEIPWVTVRLSTSGNGLHLYVKLDDVPTANHTEHAALARAILGKMSALAGCDFNIKVDAVGGNIWTWHRKFEKAGGVSGPGLKLVKQGETLFDIPINWKDHVPVVRGRSRRQSLGIIEDEDPVAAVCGQYARVPLDEGHKSLISFLEEQRALFWWNADLHMLICHTADLAKAHEALSMRGVFRTLATGREAGNDQNAWLCPLRNGIWVVRRHTKGVAEAETWEQDSAGWTKCFLNKEPDLKTISRAHGGLENDKGAFQFKEAEMALTAVTALGASLDLPGFVMGRQAVLKPHKDGRLIFEIKRESGDSSEKMAGWIEEKGNIWRRILDVKAHQQGEIEMPNYDDLCRHLVSESGDDNGWVIKSDDNWVAEPYQNTKLALGAFGLNTKDAGLVMGALVIKPWMLVNRPFQPEYPGDRCWNRGAAQFSVAPSLEIGPYGTWTEVLNHCGSGLDEVVKEHPWCKKYGIIKGGDYLKVWVAAMFQEPMERLPYLFFYGPQASGKSTFWESISLLMTKGVTRADAALTSQSGFNGELASAILCVIEETDLRNNKTTIYNKIKDYVTSSTINIRDLYQKAYTTRNSTHWVQMSNEVEACPIFQGDTRITMAYVKALDTMISKSELMAKLTKEAPDFLASILKMEIPPPCDRLRVPILVTEDKKSAEAMNQSELSQFIQDKCYKIDGAMVKMSDFYDAFLEYLDPSHIGSWSKIRVGRELTELGIIKGRSTCDNGQWYLGNLSLVKDLEPSVKKYVDGDILR